MSNFLSMGGYAGSVWPAIALTLGIVVWNVSAARRSFENARAQVRRRIAAERTP